MGTFTKTPKNMISTLGGSLTSAGRIFTPIAYSPIGKGHPTMIPPPLLTGATPNNLLNKTKQQVPPHLRSPKRLFSQTIDGGQLPTPAAILLPDDSS
jgi:hypothetical protein